MSSLVHCLKQLGFSREDRATIEAAARAYRKEGFKAAEANESAVRDIMRGLKKELSDVHKQVEKITGKPVVKIKGKPIEIKPEKEIAGSTPEAKAKTLTPKEQKKYLFTEIDRAIEEAPEGKFEEVDFPSKLLQSRQKELIDKNLADRKTKYGTITIHIPDDGDFEIINTKAHLQEFKKLAKQFPVSKLRSPVANVSKKPLGRRVRGIEGLEYYNPYQAREGKLIEAYDKTGEQIAQQYKDEWFSQGHYGIYLPEKPKFKYPVETSEKARDIKRIIPTKDLSPGKIMGEAFWGPKENAPMVHIRGKDGTEVLVNVDYFEVIKTKYPDAKIYTSGSDESPVVFKKDNKPVGVLMPVRGGALPETLRTRYEALWPKYVAKAAKKRSVQAIVKDVNTVLGERGAIGTKDLSKEQQAALARLSDDLDIIKHNAKKTGKTVEKYLTDLKFDPKVAALLSRKAEDLQKYARSINLEKQKIAEDYKQLEDETRKLSTKSNLSQYQKDNIAWNPNKIDFSKKGIKNLAAKIYTKFKMREYPVARLAKMGGEEALERIEGQVRRLRGKGGLVEEMIIDKGPFQIINFGTDKETIQYVKNPKSLQKILEPLKSRQEYIDYETLRVAERDVALAKHRPDITGVDLEASRAEIKRLEAKYSPEDMERLRKISAEHRKFEGQAVLKPLVDIGWMSQESYNNILAKPESEYYASFAREMDEIDSYTLGGKDPVKKIRGSERKKVPSVEATIANVYKTVKLIETIRLNKEVVRLKKLSPELDELITEVSPQYTVKDIPERPGPRGGTKVSMRLPLQPKQTIVVPIDGIKHFYRVPADVHKALDYYSPKEMSDTVKILSIPTKWLRAGATLSAEFIMRNPVKDQFTAYVYSNYGYKPLWDLSKGIFHILKKTNLANEFKAAGAEQAYFVSVDRQALHIKARRVLGWKAASGKDLLDLANPLHALQALSMWTEKGTRMGAYVKARKKGATPTQAMSEARELTLDFMRLGTERSLNQMIAFWNANFEGTDRMVRSFKDYPYRTTWRTLLGITIPSIALWTIFHDDKRIKALPDWRKNFFWNIPVPGGPILSIPKPFELGIIFGSLPERILDYIYDKDPDALRSMVKAVEDGAIPGLIPTSAVPIIENITDYSFFMDRPLEGEQLKRLPPSMRYRESTSELAKRAGKLTDISPIKIDNWIRGWTGTLGKQALDALDPMLAEEDIPEVQKKWYELAPGIKGFVAKEPIGSAGVDIDRFYKNMQKVIEAENGYKILFPKNPKEAFKFNKKTNGIKKFAAVSRDVAESLSWFRKKKAWVMKSKMFKPELKREKIDEINKKMTLRAKQFNDKFKAHINDL